MCYENISKVVCSTCGRGIGEASIGKTFCHAACGKYLSKPTAERIYSECRVCRDGRLSSANVVGKLRAFSTK